MRDRYLRDLEDELRAKKSKMRKEINEIFEEALKEARNREN